MAHDDSILPEVLAEALAVVVREVKAEWERELEILRAERRLLVAELRLAALGAPEPIATGEPKPAAPAKAVKPRAQA